MVGNSLYLHSSNRLEALFAELAQIISRPSGSIFQPEIVVVQSAGMGRWLSLRLAEAHGICANVEFPFPQKFVLDVFRAVLPGTPLSDAFDREVMTWLIMKELPALIGRPEFEAVRHYLGEERPELKLFQLASRIAIVFDQYLAFRPEMILDWDAGRENHWQAILWRHLPNEKRGSHPPALGKKLAEALRNSAPLANLPSRICAFGVSTLPAFYLDIIAALGSRLEVHLFVMEPTPQYWRHIVSRREEARILRDQPRLTAEELHLERGNSLLASMGKLGREFLDLLSDLEPAAHQETFIEPNSLTSLGQLQRDIFFLRDAEPGRALPDDKSIQFHSCHSPMREMEVLHDQLLALFENNPTLEPRDVIVMMPDVAAYAPYIEAVFDTPEEEQQRIPFTIADRSARAESALVDTFLAILGLAGSRFTTSSVLNILETRAVQRRFQLAEGDLETIRHWLDKTGVRWGIDAQHRASFGLPAFSQNSWREGLDRLLLGYALPARGQQLFHDFLPIDEVEGDLAEMLGNFVEFATGLFDAVAGLAEPRSLERWQTTLQQIIDRFFLPMPETLRELSYLRRVLESLGEVSRAAGFEKAIPFEVIQAHLSQALEESISSSGFLVGRVTFCALKPMRSIPFKVVCLVGMDDMAYPRKSTAPEFDLIAHHPRPGDRSTREDDRYLFLEALLSAREVFYISYIGQSLRDNSALPPSVLVSELLDYLGELPGRERIVRHRLQAFNPAYFQPNDSGLFSYSAANCRAAGVSHDRRVRPAPFLTTPLPEPETEWRAVTLDNLMRFFSHPARFFLKERLGIRLPNEERTVEEREPFELSGLSRYNTEQAMFAKQLAGIDLEKEEPLVRATGELPPGQAGATIYRDLTVGVESFVETVGQYGGGAARPPVLIDLSLDDWTLTGQIDDMTDEGLVRYRLTTIKAKDMLRLWISHLALNCYEPFTSRFIARDAVHTHPPLTKEESRRELRELLALYWRGLREPLPFFPQTSYAFVLQTLRKRGRKEPMEKALEAWLSSEFSEGGKESDDAYFDLAFRHLENPLNEKWEKLALQIFQPIIEHREETEL